MNTEQSVVPSSAGQGSHIHANVQPTKGTTAEAGPDIDRRETSETIGSSRAGIVSQQGRRRGQKTAKYQSHTRGQNHQSKDVKGKYTKLHLALRNSKNLRFREVYRQPLEWKMLVALGFILSTIYVILEYVVEVPIDP